MSGERIRGIPQTACGIEEGVKLPDKRTNKNSPTSLARSFCGTFGGTKVPKIKSLAVQEKKNSKVSIINIMNQRNLTNKKNSLAIRHMNKMTQLNKI